MAGVVALTAACGGGGSSAASAGPFGVCQELVEWDADVHEALDSVRDQGLSMKRADVVAAGEDAAQRTHELALAIHDAEFPGVDNDAPHDAFSELAAQLDIQADRIGDNAGAPEDPGGLVTYFQVLNGTVAEASNAIFATLERLEELGYRDPIQANDACRQFTLEGILGK